jgi:hypothetical protein
LQRHCFPFHCLRGGSGTCPDCKQNEENELGFCDGRCDKCSCPRVAACLARLTPCFM